MLIDRLQDDDPVVRGQAVVDAGESGDPQAVPFLVERLNDPQQEIRFLAILALEKITGTRMGYEYWEPADKRAAAVQRWRLWLEQGRPTLPVQVQEAGR